METPRRRCVVRLVQQIRLLPQRLFGLLADGDVVVGLQQGKRFAEHVRLERPSAGDDKLRSIPPRVNQFPFPAAVPGQLVADCCQRLRQDRSQQLVTGPSTRLVGRPAVLLLRTSIPQRDHVVHVADQDAVVSEIEEAGPFPQGAFGPSAFGDFGLQLGVGLLEFGRPPPNPGLHLVARRFQGAFGPPSPDADRGDEARDQHEHPKTRQVRELHRECVERSREEVVHRQRGEDRGEQRRPETAEPGGQQHGDQQQRLGVEHRLQPLRQEHPDSHEDDHTRVSDQREPSCGLGFEPCDVALHLLSFLIVTP